MRPIQRKNSWSFVPAALLFVGLTLGACSNPSCETARLIYSASESRGATALNLDALIQHFEWDTLLVVRPYTAASGIKGISDEVRHQVRQSDIRKDDQFVLLIFLHRGKVDHSVKIDRSRLDLLKLIDKRVGYSYYPRNKTEFQLSHLSDAMISFSDYADVILSAEPNVD